MNRETFEKYLNKKVNIELFNGKIIKGYLNKTHTEKFKDNPNLFIPLKYYFLTETANSKETCSCLFRVSHVKKVIV